jgi:flagellin
MSSVGSILTNQGALDALNSITNTSNTNNTLEQELSSGLQINSPADNPAGYITAQGFTSQLNGITQATSNANQGISLLQTAQGALTQQISIVQSLNSIAVQAANGTQTSQEESSLQNVVTQLTSQVSTIASQTQFNNINLLDGSFKGIQFQVGANEGQTISLSISGTSAADIGLNASKVKSGAGSAVFNTTTTGASSASGAISLTANTGLYSAGTVSVTGSGGGTATATATATSSAKALAASFNTQSGTSGVSAQATTQISFDLTAATAGSIGYAFKIKGSGSSTQTLSAKTATDLVAQINGDTGTTGITAALTTGTGGSTQLTLTQSNGANIAITGVSEGSLATLGGTPLTLKAGAATATSSASALVQGQVQFQSASSFTVGNGADIGVGSASTLTSLSSINVTTTAGANTAINVVKYALQSLSNSGGQLGAVQQRLQASVNNLNTTSENVTNALGVVQDANIPQVSNSLTQAQIQAQAGVAALKSSTTLQQSYLSLLP